MKIDLIKSTSKFLPLRQDNQIYLILFLYP